MAARAAVGASREVDGERRLVGDLAEHDVVVGVTKHGRRLFVASRCRHAALFDAALDPFRTVVIPPRSLLLPRLREVADALHVADHARQVVEVRRVAAGTLLQIAFVDVSAVVADRVGDVEREVVASLLRRHAKGALRDSCAAPSRP